jgi:hypothetical protein
MKNRIRWIIKKAIGVWARGRRAGTAFPCPVREPRAIAYYAAGGIGDIIMAHPALLLLQQSFPDTRLDLYVPRKKRDVIAAAFCGITVAAAPSTSPVTGLRFSGYDCALSNTVAAFYLAVECNAFVSSRYCYGFRYPDEAAGRRLYNATEPLDGGMHDGDQNLRLAARVFSLDSTAGPVRPAGAWRGPAPGAAVCIHPGVERGYEYKLWPLERYKDIAVRCVSAGHPVRILLGPSETHMREIFSGVNGVECMTGAGGAQLMEKLCSARMFVGNDSGPAHLAAFLGVPAITLIGPVDPKRTRPRGPHSTVVYNETDCSPCHFEARRCRDNRCMKSITVNQVWGEMEKLLTATGGER